MAVKIIVISLYALLIIVIGIRGMRKTKSFSDFFLGGGNVGPWMTAFSYGTAYFSAVVFIGFAGKVGWGFGYSGIWIGVFNAIVGVLGVWALLGWKIKKMSIDMKVATMSEYLEKRYNSPFIKLYASIAIFVFMIPYSAAVFIGLSYLFTSSFPGIEYWHAVAFMGVFTTIYIVLGGYKSMTMIDTFFGMIMTVGVIILLFYALSSGGGFINISETLQNIEPKLTAVVGPPGWWPLFALIFLTSVAPFAMPQLIQKFYAIKDKRSVKIGMVASTFFALLIGCIAYFLGSTTRFFLTPEGTPNAFTADGKPIVDALMPELLTTVIPDSLSILILLLILSASMSTLAALVLISSSSLSKDFYGGFINKNVSDKKLTSLMRYGSAFFVLLSVIIALIKPDSIVAILGISWGAIGSVFLGPFIWGLFWKRANKFGAISSSFIGLTVCIAFYIYGMSSPQAGTLGMITSLVVNPVFSLLVPGRQSSVGSPLSQRAN
ncbi:MAG: sodium:solute symporter family protein [Bacteroidota bacterium]|nr:sodium:solute symporter family protein [Bacteroidota bacterium]